MPKLFSELQINKPNFSPQSNLLYRRTLLPAGIDSGQPVPAELLRDAGVLADQPAVIGETSAMDESYSNSYLQLMRVS